MNLLGPIGLGTWAYVALAAGALAVGAYIIKMRRRRFEVPFARLWNRVLDQKDANSLWKQLKRLISLLLMLLILGLVLFAALDPTLGGANHRARSVVVLVDASASMQAMDGDDSGTQSRLQVAKTKAKDLVMSMGGGDVALVMKVDGQATPMSRFTSDGPMLARSIDGIIGSDTPADLTRALGAAADALRDRPNPLIVLVSDGAFPAPQRELVNWDGVPPNEEVGVSTKNLAAVDLSKIDVRYVPVGKRGDNVGVISFNVRRYVAKQAAYEVYVEMKNFGTEPARRQLRLYNGNTNVDSRTIDLAPGESKSQVYRELPASEDNRLRVSLQPVEVAAASGINGSDPFPLDDSAYALLPARKKQKVLMVTEDNLFLEAAMLVYDNVEQFKVKPAEYDAKPQVADGMDVVIFDDHSPAVVPMPPTHLLYFHPGGPHSPFKVRGEISNPRITEIDEDHPTMRWITLSDVYMDRSNVFSVDPKAGESALAYSVRDAVMIAKRDGKRKVVGVGFSLPSAGRAGATDMPMRVAFPMLLVNTLDWFAGVTTDLLTTYPTGRRERVLLDGVVGASEAEVKDPAGKLTKAPVIDGLATFYGARVGYYELTAKSDTGKPLAGMEIAANLASEPESNIAPSAELTLGAREGVTPGKKLAAPEAFAFSRAQKLWILFVLIALALIVVEWVTYHRRITV